MRLLRTPDACFEALTDWPYAPRYTEVDGVQVHYIDEGPRDAPPVLLMHGEPDWCYLYRHMIPRLVAAGRRVVAPDLVGFGRSDKPAAAADHSYQRQVDWMHGWLQAVDLRHITLFCQDWGSLIGLRLAAEQAERFAAVVLSNGGLPTGDERVPPVFRAWQLFARRSPWFPIGRIMQLGSGRRLSPEALAAYEAPFPSRAHRIATRVYPTFVPTRPDDPSSAANRAAGAVFRRWDKPFVTCFSTGDPITRGAERPWIRAVPGAAGQDHSRVRGGHFVQEDSPEALVQRILSVA